MLDSHTMSSPLDDLEPVTDAVEIAKLIGIVSQVHVSQAVQRYTVALAAATRRTPELSLGASPRASLHLVRAAKATAAVQGRDYVLPDDVLEPGSVGAHPPAAAQRRGRDGRPDHGDDPGEHPQHRPGTRGDPCVRPCPA